MVKIRNTVREWLYKRFNKDLVEKVEVKLEGEEVFNTGYTVQDFENDLEHHEGKMAEAEEKFEHFDDLRSDYLNDAAGTTGLTRKRYEAKARKARKKAFRYVKQFTEHLLKFERKLDDLTAYELRMIDADADAVVDSNEVAEGLKEGLMESEFEGSSVKREEADKAVERELGRNELGEMVSDEEEAVRRLERGEVSREELSLDEEMDGFLEAELGLESEDEFEEEQVEREW